MSSKTPVRATFSGSNVTGLAEYQSGEFVPLTHGGLGVSLSIGTAGQVLKVNGAGSAIEFGAVEAIVNIDNATDLESATLAVGDKILLSDGGTEGRVLLSQLDTLFSGTTKTLTNKTLTSPAINNPTITGGTFSGTFTGTMDATGMVLSGASPLVFEGATADASETTLAFVDPTTDRTITFPNATGTIVLEATGSTLTNKSIDLGNNTISGSLAEFNTALQDDSFAGLVATQTLTNKTLTSPVLNTGVSGSAILDEDNMASDSATQLATQQSIKAYVDSQNTAQDLDIVTGSGNIDVALGSESLTIAGGTGLTSAGSGTTVTLAIDGTVATLTGTQTLTNKTLTSPVMTTPQINDSSADHQYVFAVSELTADRTVTLPLLTGNDQITMDAHTSTLTNKTIDLASNTVTGSLAEFNTALQSESFAGLAATQTLTNKTISGADNTLSNIGNSSLSNSAITVSDGSNTTAVALGGTMTFAGTSNEVEVSESSGTVTIGLPANVTISGDLTVSGNTTTVNTATLAVEDPLINLATGNNSSDAVDIGFYGLYDTSGSQDLYAGMFRDAGDGKFKLFKDNQAAPTTTVNTSGTGYAVATLVANLEATTATLGGSDIISTDNTKTLTNKTIVAGNNTISGITSSHFASAVTLVINDSSGSAVKTIVGSAS